MLISDIIAQDNYSKSGSDWTGICKEVKSLYQSPIDIEDFKGYFISKIPQKFTPYRSCDNSIVLDMNLVNVNSPVTVTDVSVPGYRHLIANPVGGSLGTLYATNLNGKIYGYN